MTRDEFIKVLKYYTYKIEGDNIVVTHKGNVNLISLMSLPSGVKFKNKGDVYLQSLTSLPPGVKFENGDGVYLGSLTGYYWEGNIEGIDSRRLLNLMISKGLFI
jgi:hypothetical protein